MILNLSGTDHYKKEDENVSTTIPDKLKPIGQKKRKTKKDHIDNLEDEAPKFKKKLKELSEQAPPKNSPASISIKKPPSPKLSKPTWSNISSPLKISVEEEEEYVTNYDSYVLVQEDEYVDVYDRNTKVRDD